MTDRGGEIGITEGGGDIQQELVWDVPRGRLSDSFYELGVGPAIYELDLISVQGEGDRALPREAAGLQPLRARRLHRWQVCGFRQHVR